MHENSDKIHILFAIFAGIFLNLIEDLHIPTSERWECGSFILKCDGKLMRKHVPRKLERLCGLHRSWSKQCIINLPKATLRLVGCIHKSETPDMQPNMTLYPLVHVAVDCTVWMQLYSSSLTDSVSSFCFCFHKFFFSSFFSSLVWGPFLVEKKTTLPVLLTSGKKQNIRANEYETSTLPWHEHKPWHNLDTEIYKTVSHSYLRCIILW